MTVILHDYTHYKISDVYFCCILNKIFMIMNDKVLLSLF